MSRSLKPKIIAEAEESRGNKVKNVIPEVDSKSMDIVADNISKLKELFPEAFTEGKVDFDALKEVLGNYIDGREERYSFHLEW